MTNDEIQALSALAEDKSNAWEDTKYACHPEELQDAGDNLADIVDKVPALCAEVLRLRAEAEKLRKLDAEAATHVESVICMRTGFTGQPPYVGWEGLGLALREALDERDRLRERVRELEGSQS